ncbi:MFS transporter [Peptococcaceae bacterium 1198_IL3148]
MRSNLNFTFRDYSLLLVVFLTEFTRGAFFLTFLPMYAVKHLGISVVSAGFVVSAHYLFETIFKGAAGLFFDRHGRAIVRLGMLTALLGLVGLVYLTEPWKLMIAAAIFGLGVSPVWVAVMALVAPVNLPGRAGRVGAVFAVWLTGMGSGPVIINFAMAHSYQYTLVLLVSLFIFATVLAYFTFPNAKPNHRAKGLGFWYELKRMAGLSSFTRILLPGMFLQTLAASLLLPMLPIYANNVLGLNHNQYAFLLICGGAGALFFLVPMGKLVDRLPLKVLLTLGFGLSATFLFTITLVKNITTVFLLATLVGISYAIILPAWNTLLSKVISPELQATGWGIFGTIEGLGVAVGPGLGGIVTNAIGTMATIYLSACILVAMAIFYLLYPVDRMIR